MHGYVVVVIDIRKNCRVFCGNRGFDWRTFVYHDRIRPSVPVISVRVGYTTEPSPVNARLGGCVCIVICALNDLSVLFPLITEEARGKDHLHTCTGGFAYKLPSIHDLGIALVLLQYPRKEVSFAVGGIPCSVPQRWVDRIPHIESGVSEIINESFGFGGRRIGVCSSLKSPHRYGSYFRN